MEKRICLPRNHVMGMFLYWNDIDKRPDEKGAYDYSMRVTRASLGDDFRGIEVRGRSGGRLGRPKCALPGDLFCSKRAKRIWNFSEILDFSAKIPYLSYIG
ncbi:MAG TPA: hypothetical protein PLY23_01450 [Alphaproteobacteria bacterium]|nr:hypothetical protein [Alphaproteobacteria bacterium]HQS93337.1 hypothetical protein [Alphaproteobacteria bacterium]